jgi:hypothetical protein
MFFFKIAASVTENWWSLSMVVAPALPPLASKDQYDEI